MTSILTGTAVPTSADRDQRTQLANWKVGAAFAGIAGIASFQPSLLPRGSKQQAIVTAASVALGFGVGAASNAIANKVDRATGLDALGSRAAVAGAGALGVLGTSLALRGRPSLALEAARTTAGVVGAGAVAGAALIGEQALVDRIKDDMPGGAAAAHAAILGTAAIGTAALLLGRPRATAVTPEVEAAYLASTREGSTLVPPAFDGARFEHLTKLREQMTTVSGIRPGTLLPDSTFNSQALRFVNEATPADEIARVMGGEASAAKDPIRIYGGLHSAGTREQVAQLIFDEALAKGAFDRRHVVLYVPSGSGHVNPMPVAATEYATFGDVASIAMQYNDKPSIQSVHKVAEGTDLFERVLDKVGAHLRTLPDERRPILTAYGESLGGWSMQDAFLKTGPDGVGARGIDHMVNVGTPRFSKLRSDAIGLAGHRLDASGSMFEFNDLDTLRSLDPKLRDGVRSFLLTHRNDPVNKFSPTMFFQRPEWLSSSEHAVGVPPRMKWLPGVSGVQGIMDTVNGTNPAAGIMARTAHDYRADMAPVMAEVLRTGTTEQQLARIGGALQQLELARVHAAAPVARITDAAAGAASVAA